MRKTLSFSAILLCTPAQAAILANFDGGNGTASSDQWTGTAGNGWAAQWGSGGTTTGTGVVSTSPLSGGGNYLQVVDDTSTSGTYIRRQYNNSGDISVSSTYQISFNFRWDGDITNFNNFGDRIGLFGDVAAVTGTSSSNTWAIGVAASNTGAGAGQSVYAGNWYFFDNNGSTDFATSNMFNTNLAFVAGRVYAITVVVNPNTGTYSASISDGVNPTVSANDLTFRRGAGAVTNHWINAAMNATAGSDSSAFSIDSIVIVPEPSVFLVSAAGFATMMLRRRRIH